MKPVQSDTIMRTFYFEKGPQDTYLLGWMDLARKANMNPNDEIGLYWENRSGTFQFKVLHRGI